ncbi:MAG: hypothetical protein EBU08_21275 [Micrococcales bacterium]|nr:hypothetical protein [Micrococcales bacterium]
MKLGARTIQILKNFSQINESMMFRKGNTLTTVSPLKEMMAKATINETFDRDFGIYDLNKLLGTLSLFEEPELVFESKSIRIQNGKQTANYYYTDEKMLDPPKQGSIALNDPEINFDMTNQIFTSVTKAMHILQLSHIAFVGDRNTIKVAAAEEQKKAAGNVFQVEVGETKHEFKILIKSELLKLLPDNYQVSITSKGISRFKTTDVEYWIAVDGKNSTFTE